MLNKSLVLLTLVFTLFPVQTHAARPALDSAACAGALPLNELIRVEIVKGDSTGCPRGARSPYLCAMHKAGFAERSLGHAMRNTLVDFGNGTCERVNLRGVLIWKADGSTLEGDKFVDPHKALPAGELRFGAWKTRVLYLAPVSGEEQLAACANDLATCRAQVAKVAACRPGQLYNPATQTCVDSLAVLVAEGAAPARAEKSQCPKCKAQDCPKCSTCTAKADDARACVAARNALKQQVADLKPSAEVGDSAQACGARGQLFNWQTNQCVPSAGVSPELAQIAADRIATLEREVKRLRDALVRARGGG